VTDSVLDTSQSSSSFEGLATWVYRLVFFGLVLLPFSTSPGEGVVVISYGLPILAIAALATVYYFIIRNIRFHERMKGVIWSSCIYISLLVAYSLFSPEIIPALGRSLPHVIGFLLFLFILSFSLEEEQFRTNILRKFVDALVLSGSILSVYYIANFAVMALTKSFAEVVVERYVGGLMSLPWGASNTIAATLVIPLIAAMVSFRLDETRTWLKYCSVFLMVGAIFLTFSRTVIALLIYLFLFQSVSTRQYRLLTLFLGLVLLSGGIFFLSYREGFDLILLTRVEDLAALRNLMGRTDIWEEFIAYLRNNPFSPVGYYGSQYVFGYSGHNTLLTTMVEMGITGIVITLVFYLQLIRVSVKGIRQSFTVFKKINIVFFIGLTTIIFNLMNEDPNYTQQYVLYFWLYIGMMSLVAVPVDGSDKMIR